jgi:Zn-dependent protease with chaperone function
MDANLDSTTISLMNTADVMPGWVGWLGPAVLLFVVAIAVLLVPGLVLTLVGAEARPDQHWTKRAALFYEGRVAISFGFAWAIAGVVLVDIFDGPFTVVPKAMTVVAVLVLVFVAVLAMSRRFSRKFDRSTPDSFLAHAVRFGQIWWPFGSLVGLAFLAPAELSSFWMIPWTIVAVGSLYATRYLPDLYIASGLAWPAESDLLEIVRRAASRFGAPEPRVIVFESHAANALALPSRNLIVVTTKLLATLEEHEIEAVVAHEIAHLQEKKSVTVRRSLSIFVLLPFLALKPLLNAGLVLLLTLIAASLLISQLLARMQKTEEARADAQVVERSHESTAFGIALLKIYQVGLVPAAIKREPHGPLYDRLVRAGLEPDFGPEVPNPKRLRLILAMAIALSALVLALVGLFSVDRYDGETGSHIAIALGWDAPNVLGWIGYLRASDGDFPTASIYLEEAVAGGDDLALVDLAWSYAASGRCDEAEELLPEIAAAGLGPTEVEFASFIVGDCDA